MHAQGVQAQTMANFYLAFDQDLTIIPVINKIDMANADPERVEKELETLFDFNPRNYYLHRAKLVLVLMIFYNAIIERIPAPKS